MRAVGASLLFGLLGAAALAQQPRIDSLSPSTAPIAGGTTVTLRGENLGDASVTLDRDPVEPLSRTATEIRLSMPKHDGGYAVIAVRGPGGVAYAELRYVPPPLDLLPPGHITTVGGTGSYVRDFGKATNAVVSPSGLAFGRDGRLFVAEPIYGKVDRVDPDGTIERVTRPGSAGLSSGDGGPAIDAVLSFPTSLATDPAGNLYVPDHQYRIRRIDAGTGLITSIAGDGRQGFSGDGGPATAARLGVTAYGCVVSGDGFYFIDFDAMRIRRIGLTTGLITTVAGNGTGDEGDGGPALSARFDVGDSDRGGLAADSRGNLYLGDSKNGRLRRIDAASGVITTVASAPGIRPVALDDEDNIYYGVGGRIVKLGSDGRLIETWGSSQPLTGPPPEGGSAHGPIAGQVTGIAIDGSGNVVYSDAAVGRVRRIDLATQTIETVAGIGPAIIGENGPALASLVSPSDLEMQSDGSLLFGDSSGRLRRLEADGNVSTVAGLGMNGGPSYGPALAVSFFSVGVRSDGHGNVDVADTAVIRQLRADGQIVPLVGSTGACGYAGDGGPAASAVLCQPWDTVRDPRGNLLVADTNNNRIRRVDALTGVITTLIGNGGRVNGFERYGGGEFCGDGGPALDACLNTPYGVALDAAGDLFIAEDDRIRRVDGESGIIDTFASGLHATKLVSGRAGLLYGATYDGRLLRFDSRGQATGIAGGSPTGDGIGDGGPASEARLRISHQSAGIAIDRDGNLYVSDEGNHRIRAIRHGAVLAPPDGRVEVANGSPQSAALGERFPEPLSVLVRTASGGPAPSVRVDFACPASGPSCLFPDGLRTISAVTDASGRAAVTAVADTAPGGYTATATPLAASAAATFALTNRAAPELRLYTLPGAAETPGLKGAVFASTLTLANPGPGAASIVVTFVPASGVEPPPPAALSLAPGETRLLPHVLATLFDLHGTAGTLSISSSAPLSLALRTENVAALSTSGGVYGLALEPVGSPLSAGETGHAIWATQDASFRTNVAVALLDPSSSVVVRVYDERGSLRGETTVASATPVSWQAPLSSLVSGELPLGRLELTVISGRATGYAVVNDNVTSDAVAAQVERVEEGVVDLLLDGVARAPGLGGTHWSTDVRVFNPGSLPLPVQLTTLGLPGPPRAIGVTVPPRGLVELVDVLGPGGFGQPDGVAGAVRLRASTAFLAATRTSNRDPSGQRPGTFSASQRAVSYPGGLITAPGRGLFAGVDHTDTVPGSRSNLALLSGDGGADGDLLLFDSAGRELSRTPFSLGGNGWTQRSLAGWFAGVSALSSARVDVEIRSGSLHAYLSRIDNVTGDAVVVPILRVDR